MAVFDRPHSRPELRIIRPVAQLGMPHNQGGECTVSRRTLVYPESRIDPDPVSISRDLSHEYAQVALFCHEAHKCELRVTAATFELRLTLPRACIALIARDAVAIALAPVDDADVRECWKPRVADRSPAPLDEAYQRILADLEAYRSAVTATTAAN